VIGMFCEPSVAHVQSGKPRVPSTRQNSFYYISVNNQYLAKHVHVSFIMVICLRGKVYTNILYICGKASSNV
jgi:hypothetical protein